MLLGHYRRKLEAGNPTLPKSGCAKSNCGAGPCVVMDCNIEVEYKGSEIHNLYGADPAHEFGRL
jgi:hypothetical protein